MIDLNYILKYKITILIIPLLIFAISCKTQMERIAVKTNESRQIRVKLIVEDEINIPLRHDIVIQNAITGEKIKLTKKDINIHFKNNQIVVNDKLLEYPVIIYSKNERLIRLNDKKYFGVLKIIPNTCELKVINYIPIETYLISVVPSEVPVSFFNIEAIKAQVVVARTYAYLFMKKYAVKREFDVDDTTRYQVYKGYNICLKFNHIKKLEKAINETKGTIIIYNNQPILAYFHSNSGGKTRSGKDYYGAHSDLPYLVSKDDPYSLDYPGSKWEYNMPIDNFLQPFDLTTDLTDDSFVYNKDGFVEKINVSDNSFFPKEIRKKIGYSLIKSERFKIKLSPEDNIIFFNGIGYGHGVGMSQWGAQGMAESGYDFKKIIAFYYPHTEIIGFSNENRTF